MASSAKGSAARWTSPACSAGTQSARRAFEISRDLGRSLSRDLANSIPFDHGRDLGRGNGHRSLARKR